MTTPPIEAYRKLLWAIYGTEQLNISPQAYVILHNLMRPNMTSLTEREWEIIQYRFGFKDGSPHLLREIGKRFGVTTERIRQIEVRALRKLRNPVITHALLGEYIAIGPPGPFCGGIDRAVQRLNRVELPEEEK